MAQLQSTGITGSFNLATTTASSGSAGNVWFNTTISRLQYSTLGWSTGGALSLAV